MKIVLEIAVFIVYGCIVFGFLTGLSLIIRANRRTRDFDRDESILKHSDIYSKLGNISPDFVTQDLTQSIQENLNPHAGYIHLIFSSLNIMGLLGTFVGLSQALPFLHKIDNSTLSNIARSVSTAFVSSILGILCALPLSFLARGLNRKIDLLAESVREGVFGLLFQQGKKAGKVWNPEEFFQSIRDYFTDSMDKFSLEVNTGYQNLKEWSAELIASNTEQVLKNTEDNGADLKRVVSALKNEREDLNKIKSSWGKSIEQLHKASENIAKMTQNVNNFAELTEQLIDKIEAFGAVYQDQITLVHDLMSKANQPSETMQNLSRTLELNANQNQELVKMQTATQEVLMSTAEAIASANHAQVAELQSLIGSFTGEIQKNLEETRQTNDTTSKEAQKTFTEFVSKLSAQNIELISKQQAALDRLGDKISGGIDPLKLSASMQLTELRHMHENLVAVFNSLIRDGVYTYEKG